MAKFRCRACGEEGTFVYDGRQECPHCRSVEVQFALGIEELPDGDPLVEAIKKPTEEDDKESED
jgi:hypothetical protein